MQSIQRHRCTVQYAAMANELLLATHAIVETGDYCDYC